MSFYMTENSIQRSCFSYNLFSPYQSTFIMLCNLKIYATVLVIWVGLYLGSWDNTAGIDISSVQLRHRVTFQTALQPKTVKLLGWSKNKPSILLSLKDLSYNSWWPTEPPPPPPSPSTTQQARYDLSVNHKIALGLTFFKQYLDPWKAFKSLCQTLWFTYDRLC